MVVRVPVDPARPFADATHLSLVVVRETLFAFLSGTHLFPRTRAASVGGR